MDIDPSWAMEGWQDEAENAIATVWKFVRDDEEVPDTGAGREGLPSVEEQIVMLIRSVQWLEANDGPVNPGGHRERHIVEQYAAGLRAALGAGREGLDVERLARALARVESQAPDDASEAERNAWREYAADILAALGAGSTDEVGRLQAIEAAAQAVLDEGNGSRENSMRAALRAALTDKPSGGAG